MGVYIEVEEFGWPFIKSTITGKCTVNKLIGTSEMNLSHIPEKWLMADYNFKLQHIQCTNTIAS